MSPEIETLLQLIEQKLDWGESKQWQTRDFENLNQLILDDTGVSLSASTLRRLWGKVTYKHLPSATTLDTLARFGGFENWRTFLRRNAAGIEATTLTTNKVGTAPVKPTAKRNLAGLAALITIIVLAGIFAMRKSKAPINSDKYSFSSRKVTRQIPNSVIFTYDASASPTDSVYIQQSWDSRTRTLVDKNLHQHTSIYYEPGFYRAKLYIDTTLVREHPLLIPTDGWLGLISNKMIPVYLDSTEFIFKDSLQLDINQVAHRNLQTEPMAPVVKYYNVGNFQPVSVNDFSFSCDIKNNYINGANACQFSGVLLVTDDAPIYIPISVPGCVSELSLRNIDEVISGKTADLSGFGVNISEWTRVSTKSIAGKTFFFINDKQIYACTLPNRNVNIVGLLFMFQGAGAVKNIRLVKGQTTIFAAFN